MLCVIKAYIDKQEFKKFELVEQCIEELFQENSARDIVKEAILMKAQRKADEGLDSSFYTGNEKQNMNVSILSKSKLDLSQTSHS